VAIFRPAPTGAFPDQFRKEFSDSASVTPIRQSARNPAVGIGASEDVWPGGGLYGGWLTAAAPLRIQAGGNAADDAAGAGARSVVLQPIGATFDWTSDESVVLATAGIAASAATAGSFLGRCLRAYVLDSGAYANGAVNGSNTGAITIETTAGVVVAVIPAGRGDSEFSGFTVPQNHSLWLKSARIQASAAVDVQAVCRERADVIAAPFGGRRTVFDAGSVVGDFAVDFDYSIRLPPKTDFWWTALGGVAVSDLSVEWTGLLMRLGV